MKLGNLSKLVTALTVATTVQLIGVDSLLADNGKAYKIIGLTANNTLVRFDSDSRESNKAVKVTGINGNLQCIDFRPANGKLYGLTDTDKIYTINHSTGAAALVSTLSVSFNGGFQSGCDFNPAVDRLRVVGSNDQNFRINVDDGTVTVDTTLAYAAGTPNVGVDGPNITGSAYTQSFRGPGMIPPTRTTQLYGIDYDLNVLVLQDPPNDGTLTTVGPLGFNLAPIAGFDIFTPSAGAKDTAFVLSGSTLYTINLKTGAATKLGNMPTGGYVGLAVTLKNKD